MMQLSIFVKDESELDFMKRHLDEKGIVWEIRRNMRNGKYSLYREYKAVGKNRPPEPIPDRKAWDSR